MGTIYCYELSRMVVRQTSAGSNGNSSRSRPIQLYNASIRVTKRRLGHYGCKGIKIWFQIHHPSEDCRQNIHNAPETGVIQQAEQLAQKEGKNTSEFFRSLLREYNDKKMLEVHLNIVDKYENVLGKYKELLTKYDKKEG